MLSRLVRQFTSSPLTCEFFGGSHHQVPLCYGQCILSFDRPLPTLNQLVVLDDHSMDSCCQRSFCALGRILSDITSEQHFDCTHFILLHKKITRNLVA